MSEHLQKIAIISHSLGGGGAERFACTLSMMLDQLGYDVHVIIINDQVDFPYSGKLYNLGKIVSKPAFFRPIKKGMLLKRYLNDQNIKTIIDNRARNFFLRDFFTSQFYKGMKTFYMVHSYRLKTYFPTNPILARMLYQRASKLICVSKAIEDKVNRQFPSIQTTTIYNAVDTPAPVDETVTSEKIVLFFGRLDDKVKNLSLLLQGFVQSKIYENGFKLCIMGDGPDRVFITKLILKYNLTQHVELLRFQKDPQAYVKKARFTVLTSRYEGFPMSVIESLAIGTPVVSVDCKSGPSELIINRHNGLLVPNHDPKALAKAFAELAEEGELYHICKNNARDSVRHLSVENISQQWKHLLISV